MTEDLLRQAISFSKAGFTIFKCVGKRPAEGLKWRQHPYTMPDEVEEYLEDWNHNYAIAPTRNQLVIDIDPRNFKGEDKPHLRLFKDIGLELKGHTTTVQTGGVGLHVFLRLPDLPEGLKVTKNPKIPGESAEIYPGIDFLSDGAYAIGAGSIHPDSKKVYQLLGQPFPLPYKMKEANESLVGIITAKRVPKKVGNGLKINKDEDPQIIDRFSSTLNAAPIAVEGENGDATTYAAACKGRDYGISAQKTFELMWENYNPRCVPPWDAEVLREKVENAYKYASGEAGSKAPEMDFENVEVGERHVNWRGWDRNQKGLSKTRNNVVNYFINYHEDDKSPLHHSLMFNEFSHEITKRHWMPWDQAGGKRFPEAGIEWADKDTTNLAAHLSILQKFDVATKMISESLVHVAMQKRIHPIRDFLRDLTWDGVPRLEKWLIDNSGAVDTQLNREASKLMILQAVARVIHPGCQADIVFILEGDQGIGKTTVVRILGGEFYADVMVDPNNKDTPDAMRGKWFLEMSEMAVTKRADAESLKSFLTKGTDRYRAPFASKPTDVPRQSVFIGTVNLDAMGEYLNDPTGGRRFWPVDLHNVKVDRDSLRNIRDQLLAEAYEYIVQGGAWHTENEALLEKLSKEQARRQISDSWGPMIQDYVENRYFVTGSEVYTEALVGLKNKFGLMEQKRVATCLKELGYIRKVRKIKGRSVRGYANEDYKALDRPDVRKLFE